ncbi:MAG: pyridoxal phosphate-dependent class II aminotransferase [Rhodobacteraceae bacterium]|nr:pyridoxal phosphate-dependent class II aminotransferase [Paracoccaceae bacterium]
MTHPTQNILAPNRDHGGGLDAAIDSYGGARADWMDLSSGINPVPYPMPDVLASDWTALPDAAALTALTDAARAFWQVPGGADILAAPGTSAIIAQIPRLAPPGTVSIPPPTYNEHAAAFRFHGWREADGATPDARVHVHPNNPDGRLWTRAEVTASLSIIDESFCDTCPDHSLIKLTVHQGTLVLKSFGKFWGLAGLRLGFVIGQPDLITFLREALGPWAVSGPALRIGTVALSDHAWAHMTRRRLWDDSTRLDGVMNRCGAELVGGTALFRLYRVENATAWQARLARHHIWTRIFPYSSHLLRLGLPPADKWARLDAAL